MARVLMVWELGQGLGHRAVLRPLALRLKAAGHEVSLAARDLTAAWQSCGTDGMALYQAPHVCARVPRPVRQPLCTFAHVLHNTALGDLGTLRGLVAGWRTLLDQTRPDLVVFDHSPSGLVAAAPYRFHKVLVGTGFCCPPQVAPFPNWRPGDGRTSRELEEDERRVLANVNEVSSAWQRRPYARLSEIYARADRTLLTTIPELDHFPGRDRRSCEYHGGWSSVVGCEPRWPDGAGTRVFAYLKPFRELSATLGLLAATKRPCLVFVPGATDELRRQFECSTLRIESNPVDLEKVARQCDVAIHHGGHGATVHFLLRGRPLLLIPTQLEQRLTTDRVVRLGVGVGASQRDPDDIGRSLDRLLKPSRLTRNAERLARKHRELTETDQADRVAGVLHRMLG